MEDEPDHDNHQQPATLSGRKRKKTGFRGTANWEVVSPPGYQAVDQDVDLGVDAPLQCHDSLRVREPVNYSEPRARGMPYSVLTGTCSDQLAFDTSRVTDIMGEICGAVCELVGAVCELMGDVCELVGAVSWWVLFVSWWVLYVS
jgi:hypothetical protein